MLYTVGHTPPLESSHAITVRWRVQVRPEFKDTDGCMMPARVYEDQHKRYLGPGLCVSRAIGDLEAAKAGVIAAPEICIHSVNVDDRFVILASDGVWCA
jgi:hypothetical protein